MKSRTLTKLMALVAVFVTYASLAWAADSSCWTPRRPPCPDGVSNEHGRGSCGGVYDLIEVDTDSVRTQEDFCVTHSRKCSNPWKKCNMRKTLDALWRKVFCVNQETGVKTFLGWCLDHEFGWTPTNIGCDGKPCRQAIGAVGVGIEKL